ncbi:lipopolysaccharide biosynthesis protein [Bradyrhizobium sp. CCBAU 21359]|uniref:lipopolysaccharide biosynthesis protein n=1 Tax=Bradyrhizobium sp. CCBAU 21359 TaxID=1325080 RepID=UPI0023050378|nr:hypothetical protein [Bradyrhizobium sp. CCBAU 21359]
MRLFHRQDAGSSDTTTRRLFRGFSAAGFHQIVNIALQLGLVPIFASKWGASLYGVWLLLFTIPSFLALSDFGFGAAAGTAMTMRVARHHFGAATCTFQSAWAIILVLSSSLCALVVTVIWLLPTSSFPTIGLDHSNALRLTSTGMVLYGWACMQSGVFLGALRAEGKFALSTYISAFTYLFEGVLAAAAVVCDGSLFLVALAYAIGRICGVAYLMRSARLHAPWVRLDFSRATRQEIRTLVPLAAASMTVPISLACLLQGTALAIGAAAGPVEVAIFSCVRTLTRAGVQFGGLLSQSAVPEFSAAYARSERLKLAKLYAFTIVSACAILAPAFIILSIFGTEFVDLWTHGSIHCSSPFIVLMSISMVLNGIWTPVSNLLQAMNRQRSYSYTYLVLSGASILATYFLSVRLGALGGAISFVGLDAIMWLLVQFLSARLIASPAEIVALLRSMSGQLLTSKPVALNNRSHRE